MTLARAFRGIWTRSVTLADVADEEPTDVGPRLAVIGRPQKGHPPRILVANLRVDVGSWRASAANAPDLSTARYVRVARLVNAILRTVPRPDYVLLPELALPQRWVESVVNRLLGARISVVAGVEYRHFGNGRLLNEAVLALTDDRLGFDAAVLIRQPKSAPAPAEEEELLRSYGRTLWSSRALQDDPRPENHLRVYRHHGFDFGVLICSELQHIGFRAAFQGQVDCLMVPSWNKDLETFSPLVESAALDIHAYVAVVNNALYGDSRVRCPAKKDFERDVCRIKGGENDFGVVARLNVDGLRRFQSRAKNWPRDDDPFKPVPQGFKMSARRRAIEDAMDESPDVESGDRGPQASPTATGES